MSTISCTVHRDQGFNPYLQSVRYQATTIHKGTAMISAQTITIQPSDRVYAPDDRNTLVRIAGHQSNQPKPGPAISAINGALKAFVSHNAYPCVGAKAALNKDAYRIAQYAGLGRHSSIVECTHDIQWFAANADQIDPDTASFVAVFDDPSITNEEDFEDKLWTQLQGMHDIDSLTFDWDPAVSSDPVDPDFSFSIAGRAFFIVGMPPQAAREARRFPYPTLIFNLHDQFEAMREQGRYERMRDTIREREESLAGSPNPLLADHGTTSEAQQYAGRPHACPWHPEFKTRTASSHNAPENHK